MSSSWNALLAAWWGVVAVAGSAVVVGGTCGESIVSATSNIAGTSFHTIWVAVVVAAITITVVKTIGIGSRRAVVAAAVVVPLCAVRIWQNAIEWDMWPTWEFVPLLVTL